jgi:hypothetical protein
LPPKWLICMHILDPHSCNLQISYYCAILHFQLYSKPRRPKPWLYIIRNISRFCSGQGRGFCEQLFSTLEYEYALGSIFKPSVAFGDVIWYLRALSKDLTGEDYAIIVRRLDRGLERDISYQIEKNSAKNHSHTNDGFVGHLGWHDRQCMSRWVKSVTMKLGCVNGVTDKSCIKLIDVWSLACQKVAYCAGIKWFSLNNHVFMLLLCF